MIITKKELKKKYKYEIIYFLEQKINDPLFHIFSTGNKLTDFIVFGLKSDYIFKIVFPNEKFNLETYKTYIKKRFPDEMFTTHKFYLIYPGSTSNNAQFLEICT